MSRTVKAGFLAGMAVATAKVVWERPWRTEVAPSERLDAWVPEAQFRDTIVVTGSGHKAAQMIARQAASGRRARQMCSVEMCPWRIDFSRRACAEMARMGRSTSIRRRG
jgi:hypothetical protein